jgi:hypothetical protein
VPEGGLEDNTVDVALPYGGLLDGTDTIADDEAGAVESEIPVDDGTAADDGGADDGSSTGKLVRVPSVKVEAEVELEALRGGMSVHQITPDLFSVQDVTNDLLGPGVTELGGAMVSVMTMTLVRTTVLVAFAGGEGEGSVLFETPLDDGGLPVGVGVVPPVPGNEVTGGRVMSSVLLESGGL